MKDVLLTRVTHGGPMGADLQKTNILPVIGAEGRVHEDTWRVGGQGQES